MADPVTLAMMGAAAGAVTNKKDPLKGALLGATLGGVGGAVAPSLLGTGAAAVPASGGLLGGYMPAAALETQLAAAPAAQSIMSRVSPQALMAAGQLAGSMSPQQQRAQPLPLRPAQQSQVVMQDIPQITRSFVVPEEPPGILQSQLRPDNASLMLNYFPFPRGF